LNLVAELQLIRAFRSSLTAVCSEGTKSDFELKNLMNRIAGNVDQLPQLFAKTAIGHEGVIRPASCDFNGLSFDV